MLRWFLVLCWMGLIFTLSSIPSLHSPFGALSDFVLRKLAHISMYAGLTVLLFLALERHMASTRQAWLLAALLAASYALTDEWHQTWVYGRQGAWRDVGIDTLGIALSYGLGKAARSFHAVTNSIGAGK